MTRDGSTPRENKLREALRESVKQHGEAWGALVEIRCQLSVIQEILAEILGTPRERLRKMPEAPDGYAH